MSFILYGYLGNTLLISIVCIQYVRQSIMYVQVKIF